MEQLRFPRLSGEGLRHLNHKLRQAEADHWLLNNDPDVDRAIWFSPYTLPDQGPASELKKKLTKYGIENMGCPTKTMNIGRLGQLLAVYRFILSYNEPEMMRTCFFRRSEFDKALFERVRIVSMQDRDIAGGRGRPVRN